MEKLNVFLVHEGVVVLSEYELTKHGISEVLSETELRVGFDTGGMLFSRLKLLANVSMCLAVVVGEDATTGLFDLEIYQDLADLLGEEKVLSLSSTDELVEMGRWVAVQYFEGGKGLVNS